jgi:hypothetical protein
MVPPGRCPSHTSLGVCFSDARMLWSAGHWASGFWNSKEMLPSLMTHVLLVLSPGMVSLQKASLHGEQVNIVKSHFSLGRQEDNTFPQDRR